METWWQFDDARTIKIALVVYVAADVLIGIVGGVYSANADLVCLRFATEINAAKRFRLQSVTHCDDVPASRPPAHRGHRLKDQHITRRA